MKTMKKILACALAVMLVLALTACGAKCAHCGQRVKGDGYKADDKVYCNENCHGRAGLADMLTDIQEGNYTPSSNNNGSEDDKGEEIPEKEELPEGDGGSDIDELPEEDEI